MREQLICDDRLDPSHRIRSKFKRRKKSAPVISQIKPLLDSDGNLVCAERRYHVERRGHRT